LCTGKAAFGRATLTPAIPLFFYRHADERTDSEMTLPDDVEEKERICREQYRPIAVRVAHLISDPVTVQKFKKYLRDYKQEFASTLPMWLVPGHHELTEYVRSEEQHGWVAGDIAQTLKRDYLVLAVTHDSIMGRISITKGILPDPKVREIWISRIVLYWNDDLMNGALEQVESDLQRQTEAHKDSLAGIGNTVHKLVQDSPMRQQFQQQIAAFRSLRGEFRRALQRAKKAAIADPKLRYDYDDVRDKDKAPPKPPKKGYEVEHYYVLPTSPKGYWRPPLPFDPDAYLVRFRCRFCDLTVPDAEYRRRNEAKMTKEQKLACECALFAAIHDIALDIPACDRLTDPERDDWVEGLWTDVRQEGVMGDDMIDYADRRNRINTALADVQADLRPPKRAKAPQGKDGQGRPKAKDSKKRFNFNEAQAFYDGKDLGLPAGESVSILQRLFESSGEVVKHKDLDQNSNPSNASDILKGRVRTINEALRRHKIPYKVESKRGVGYVLQHIRVPSR
jgi:hypothetical protein